MSAVAAPQRRRRRAKSTAKTRPRPNVAAKPRLERSRAAGRAASFSSYVIVGIVGLLISLFMMTLWDRDRRRGVVEERRVVDRRDPYRDPYA